MMYRAIPSNKMLCLTLASLVMLLLQASMPAEAGISCSKGGEFNDVSEYLENPLLRIKGRFEEWVQSEVNMTRALIERHAADFDPERAGNTLDYLSRTIGESRGRLARIKGSQNAELFGKHRIPGSMFTPFFETELSPMHDLPYSQVAYSQQSEIGESLKTLYETEAGSAAEMISLESLGVMRVQGSDAATLGANARAIYPSISQDLEMVWANFSEGDPMTYYLYGEALNRGVVVIITGDNLSNAAGRTERHARIWSRIKLAWSEAIGASDEPVFFRKASDFAWLYAHHQPYLRGSASILEVKLWALFASNGYKVDLYDRSIDLHALSTMKQEDFNLAPLLGLD